MLDTILNIGINDETVHGLIRMTGDARLAWDSYRRVLQSFAETIYGCDPKRFDAVSRRRISAGDGASLDDLDTSALRDMVTAMLEEFRQACRAPFPQDPLDQLTMAVEAIFDSWHSRRAADYRRLHDIADDIGTAVTVQAMVFGNRGGRSGSGVGFTRNPATGAAEPYADFLFNAQGEDIVAGRHILHGTTDLELLLPTACKELRKVQTILESEFTDMQDFEFTIEDGVLYMLQTRSGKRTPWAGVRIAVELAEAGIIDAGTALERLGDYDLGRIERQRLVVKPGQEPVALATPASIGFAAGRIALCPARARELAAAGEPVILVRETTSTEDIAAIAVAAGILTAAGGRTSHAAVIAREMGTVCLVGCRELNIDAANRVCHIGTSRLQEKDYLSLDADCGRVYSGRLEYTCERPTDALARIEQWRRELGTKSATV
jgi:pyruvate,orthophosphate dikinase